MDIFSALENFNTKVSTIETLVTNTPCITVQHLSFPLEGERLTLQKSFSFFQSYATPPVSSAGPL